jgi:hypothetical protein
MPHEEQADLYSNPATPVYSDINVPPLLARDPASFWKSGIGDVILALGAAYFIVLGLVSFSQNGKTVDEVSWLPSLVTAATYVSTVAHHWPINRKHLLTETSNRVLPSFLSYFLLPWVDFSPSSHTIDSSGEPAFRPWNSSREARRSSRPL